jgi:hypothetical protein
MRHREKLAKIAQFLEEKGESVISGWIHEGSLKPYQANLAKVQTIAGQSISSLIEADIFVLISDPEGTDMFIELGVCLARDQLSPGSVKIYLVGEHSKRSLMQLHPSIIHVADLCELFEKEGIDCRDFPFPNLS